MSINEYSRFDGKVAFFTGAGSGTYSRSSAILSPLAYAQSKNLSTFAALAGFSCVLYIRMKVAPLIGQVSFPAWSVSTWKKVFDQSALAAAALKLSASGGTKLPSLFFSSV